MKNTIGIFILLALAMLGVSGAVPAKDKCTMPRMMPAMAAGCANGCCADMACCVQTPAQPALPAVPASGQHASFDFSVALMAATRPLLGLLPNGLRDFFSTVSAPVGRSRDSLALLCVRLI
ncbi:MAG: hypothetical protein ABI883_07090 [Chthoniobacterales bacterium]